ncbi:MAG TPA: hypothetical protein VK698_07880 [Kofleriaceae bacterium]|nr:hypothetical protein [Kofleriaceae bacterium]
MTGPGGRGQRAEAGAIGRRDILRAAGGVIAGARLVSLVGLVGCGGALPAEIHRAAEVARSYFGGDPGGGAQTVGDAYRAALGDGPRLERDLEPLVARITALDTGDGDDPVVTALAAQVADELGGQGLVRLDGWTCAPTELRLCALVALAG